MDCTSGGLAGGGLAVSGQAHCPTRRRAQVLLAPHYRGHAHAEGWLQADLIKIGGEPGMRPRRQQRWQGACAFTLHASIRGRRRGRCNAPPAWCRGAWRLHQQTMLHTADHGQHFTCRLAISIPPPGSSMPQRTARSSGIPQLHAPADLPLPAVPIQPLPQRDRCLQLDIWLTQDSARPTALSNSRTRPSPATALCVVQRQGKHVKQSNRADGVPSPGSPGRAWDAQPAARGRCEPTLDVE